MTTELNENARRMLQKNANITVDAETHRLMCELAAAAGCEIPELLRRLANRYHSAGYLSKQMVVNFLRGVTK